MPLPISFMIKITSKKKLHKQNSFWTLISAFMVILKKNTNKIHLFRICPPRGYIEVRLSFGAIFEGATHETLQYPWNSTVRWSISLVTAFGVAPVRNSSPESLIDDTFMSELRTEDFPSPVFPMATMLSRPSSTDRSLDIVSSISNWSLFITEGSNINM